MDVDGRPFKYKFNKILNFVLPNERMPSVFARFEVGKRAFFFKFQGMDKEILDKSIIDLVDEGKISVRVGNILNSLHVKTVEGLAKMTRLQLIKSYMCGKKAISEIEDCLDSFDLRLDMTDSEIDKIKGIERPVQDKYIPDEYWKKLFLDTSINIIGDMKDMDWNTWNTHVNNSIEISKDIVRKLKREIDNIDIWINA